MGADWIIVGVVIAAGLLLLAAWLKSRFKNYKLVSPIKKVEHRKKRAKKTGKKRKSLVIRLG